MKLSSFYLNTLREAPSEAELISHQLMLRAGLVKKLGAGLYSWLPLGLRVLRKIETIVREEMNRAGAHELLMPAVQPAELWQETGRWQIFGPQMLKIKDRHERDFCFGPTHEEVITDIVRQDIRSYRQLPVNLYQIQTKFRDEIRPRFGVMRAREFVMKDAYSFHTDYEDLQREYHNMYEAYSRIFERLGLRYRAVAADTGAIGGTGSHEFHVLADSGEDAIAYCPDSEYAANVELAEALPPPQISRSKDSQPLTEVSTPNTTRCEDVAKFLNTPVNTVLKTIAIISDDQLILLLLRGDHQLNEVKTSKVDGISNFRFASDEEIKRALGCIPGYIGPVGINPDIRLIADHSVNSVETFVCGANKEGFHFQHVDIIRDVGRKVEFTDIRNVIAGDPSPDRKGSLEIMRGIEVGHIFQLRTKYSEALKCQYLDKDGKTRPTEMGCYGIGVSRIVAAAIEQGHDERGVIWPASIAPFHVAIATIGYKKNEEVRNCAAKLENELMNLGMEVLVDDRDERPGVMFADLELIGIPYRITLGERGLKEGLLEIFDRKSGAMEKIKIDSIVDFFRSKKAN